MRAYNQKIEQALGLLQSGKVGEASAELSTLVQSDDKAELARFIEAVLTENARERSETRETLKTFMSSISWRVRMGYGFR